MKKKTIALLLVLTFLVSGTSAFAANIHEAPDEVAMLSYDEISRITPKYHICMVRLMVHAHPVSFV